MKKIIYILLSTLIGANIALADSAAIFTTYPKNTANQNKWIVRDTNPGQSYQESIMVENLSDQKINLKLEVIESAGTRQNIRLIENQPPLSVGKWIKLSEPQVSLSAKEKKEIKLNFSIPDSAQLGKYQAVVLVSHLEKNADQLNISTRIGNRIYLNVTDNKILQTNTLQGNISTTQILLITLSLCGIIYGISHRKSPNQKSLI